MRPRHQVTLPGLNKRLVQEFDRSKARELMVVVVLLALVLLPLLVYVWQNVEWIRSGYAFETLKNERDRLVETNHRLRVEKASLESLTRVESLARTQLGLEEPPEGSVVLVGREHDRILTAAVAAIAPGSSAIDAPHADPH